MHNLDANSLIIFHHIAQARSLTKAADELGLSRSALSHRIKAIETKLGCPLLLRTTRNIGLTDAGYRLANYADRIAATLMEANLLANGLNEDASGLIRISAPPGLGSIWLRPLVMSYMLTHPRVSIDLRLSEQVVDITKDPVDIAIRVTSHPPENVVAKKLFDISWWLCASPEILSRFAGPLSTPDIATIPIVGFSRSNQFRPLEIYRGRKKLETMHTAMLISNDLQVVKDAVTHALGIAVLPDYYVKEDLTNGRLIRLFPDWTIEKRYGEYAFALHLPGRMMPLRVRKLIEFLRVPRITSPTTS